MQRIIYNPQKSITLTHIKTGKKYYYDPSYYEICYDDEVFSEENKSSQKTQLPFDIIRLI